MWKGLVLVGAAVILSGCVFFNLKPTWTDPSWSHTAEKLCGASPPKPFAFDGCSLFPDGDYAECCLTHDMEYWCGGSFLDRVAADLRLAQCVGGELGTLMFVGVRLGGWSWVPGGAFRWGYGWPYPSSGD